ncbi:MAG: hypothetical protein K9K64_05235 [Desulfohalobiaceae bacterium]|nr:hypothetical protein [Desulfohalobiaceae bacterium]
MPPAHNLIQQRADLCRLLECLPVAGVNAGLIGDMGIRPGFDPLLILLQIHNALHLIQ